MNPESYASLVSSPVAITPSFLVRRIHTWARATQLAPRTSIIKQGNYVIAEITSAIGHNGVRASACCYLNQRHHHVCMPFHQTRFLGDSQSIIAMRLYLYELALDMGLLQCVSYLCPTECSAVVAYVHPVSTTHIKSRDLANGAATLW